MNMIDVDTIELVRDHVAIAYYYGCYHMFHQGDKQQDICFVNISYDYAFSMICSYQNVRIRLLRNRVGMVLHQESHHFPLCVWKTCSREVRAVVFPQARELSMQSQSRELLEQAAQHLIADVRN